MAKNLAHVFHRTKVCPVLDVHVFISLQMIKWIQVVISEHRPHTPLWVNSPPSDGILAMTNQGTEVEFAMWYAFSNTCHPQLNEKVGVSLLLEKTSFSHQSISQFHRVKEL